MKKILLATHNEAKIRRYRALFGDISGLELLTLTDLGVSAKVDEPFATAEENSAHKAREYGRLSQLPTIAIDEAVRTNFLPENEQPGVFVRRLTKGRELSDSEVLAAWQDILRAYPHDDRQFIWNFCLSFYDPEKEEGRQVSCVQINTVTEKFSASIDHGYPMSSFLIPEGSDRPHSELSEEERLAVDKRVLSSFVDFAADLLADSR